MQNSTEKKDNYELCYDKLFEQFKTKDFAKAAEAAGAVYTENKIVFDFFGERTTLNCATGEILPNAQRDALLIITHFLRYETFINKAHTGKLISLKEAPGGGALFYPAFKEMALDPLAAAFGGNAAKIHMAAKALGGTPADIGHSSITVNAFPKVPVTLVIWEGDEEIPPAAAILYDESVSAYAHIEDVIGIGITAAEKAITACK